MGRNLGFQAAQLRRRGRRDDRATSFVKAAPSDRGSDDNAAPASAMPATFSTDHLEARDRFDYWRAIFDSVHDVEIEPYLRQAFSAESSHWMLGSILLGVYETPERRIARSSKRCAQNDVDHWVLRVPVAGRIISRSKDDILVAQPRELIFGTFGRPYEESQVAGEWIAAMFPRNTLPILSGSPPPVSVLRSATAQLLADFLCLLPNRLHRRPRRTCRRLERPCAS